MQIKSGSVLFLIILLFACQADPDVLPDDGNSTPNFPKDSLVCDSLLVPNTFFSNAIGEVLIFTDSLETAFDTLVCDANEAWTEVVDFGQNGQACGEYYRTAYHTNWLPFPDRYSIEFAISKSLVTRHSALSFLQEDFYSEFTDAGGVLENRYNTLTINGKTFKDVDIYNCRPGSDCVFVEAFAISKNAGLIAFMRKGNWWTIQ